MTKTSVAGVSWRICLGLILFLTFFPFVFMIMTSLKDTHQFYHSFWLPSWPVEGSNYVFAFQDMHRYIWNSLIVTAFSVFGILVFSSVVGFLFARYAFPGRELLYYGILAMMMVPYVLVLVPDVSMHVLERVWQEREARLTRELEPIG